MLKAVRMAALVLAAQAALAGSASASIIEVNIASRVSWTDKTPFYGLNPSIGDPVSIQFTYDTDAVAVETGGFWARYNSGSAVISLDGHTITVAGPAHQFVAPNRFCIQVGTLPAGYVATTPMLVDGISTNGLFEFDFPGSLSDVSPPTLAEFDTLNLGHPYLAIIYNTGPGQANGGIEFDQPLSISAKELGQVPEPSSPALMGAALLAAVAGLGRRRIRAV